MKYSFDETYVRYHYNVDAQKAGEEIEQLRIDNDGLVTADHVLELAEERPRSACHKAVINCDEDTALYRYYKSEARKLIKALRIRKGGKLQKAFLGTGIKHGFHSYDQVMADEELRDQRLKDVFRKLTSLNSEYSDLKELNKTFREADRAKTKHRKTA